MKIKYYYPRKQLTFNILDSTTKELITPTTITINGNSVEWLYDNGYKIQAPSVNHTAIFSIIIEAKGYNNVETEYTFNTLNGGVVYMSAVTDSLFDFRFYVNKVWDVMRDPAFPQVGVEQKITVNGLPYKNSAMDDSGRVQVEELQNGNYISLVDRCKYTELLDTGTEGTVKKAIADSTAIINSGVNLEDIYVVATALYNAQGEMIEYIGDYGVLWGLSDEGFLFTDYSAKERGTFFFIKGNWTNKGQVLTYTPKYTIVTSLDIIQNFFKKQ